MILTGTQERDCSVAVSELFGFGNLILFLNQKDNV